MPHVGERLRPHAISAAADAPRLRSGDDALCSIPNVDECAPRRARSPLSSDPETPEIPRSPALPTHVGHPGLMDDRALPAAPSEGSSQPGPPAERVAPAARDDAPAPAGSGSSFLQRLTDLQ